MQKKKQFDKISHFNLKFINGPIHVKLLRLEDIIMKVIKLQKKSCIYHYIYISDQTRKKSIPN